MDAVKVLGIIVGALVIVTPTIKWLIGDWYKKAQLIEELRRKQTKDELEKLEKELTEAKGYIRILNANMQEHKALIATNNSRMDDLAFKIDHTTEEMLDYSRNLKTHMTTEIKTEVKKLGDQLIMLRNKRASGNK